MSTNSIKGGRNLLKLMVVPAAFFSLLSVAAAPAAAQPAAPDRAVTTVTVAATPHVRARNHGHVTHRDFALNSLGARRARSFVHDRRQCGDSFCTIQRLSDRYRAYRMSGCDFFDLYNFRGRFDAHNHGSLTVTFLDPVDRVIGRYAGGRHTPVRWGPVYAVRTCNR